MNEIDAAPSPGAGSGSANGSAAPPDPTSWSAAVLFAGYCLFTAVFIAIFRAPFQSPPLMVTIYYALIGIAAMAAYGAGERLAARDLRRSRSLPALLFVLALAVPFATASARLDPALAVAAIVAVAGVALAAGPWRPMPWKGALLSIAFSAALAGYCFLTINAMRYATVLSPEDALAGLLHRDTLYHSAIAAMFRQFGVPSTGLDGIPLTHYHTLSHIWLGSVADGVGLNAVFGYFLGNQVVLIPLMYFSVAVATRAMLGTQLNAAANLASAVLPIAVLLLVGLVDWNSYLVSETHAVGLALVLLGLAFLVSVADRLDRPIPMSTLAIGLLIGLLACASKVSAGGVFLVAFYYLLLRSRQLTRLQYALLALFGLLLLLLLQAFILPAAHLDQSKLNPFHFLWTYRATAIVNLVPILIATVISVRSWKKKENRPLQEALLIMLAASTAPALLLQVDGGSAYYFINIATWIAAAIIAATIVRVAGARWARPLYALAIGAALLLMGVDLTQRNTLSRFTDLLARPQQVVSTIPGFEAGQSIVENLTGASLGRLVATIAEHRGDGAPIVMIEPELWEQLPYSCPTQPFFVPAYVGLPLLLGLQPQAARCQLEPHYSFPDYGPQSPPQSGLSDGEVCALAQARGFAEVLRVETLDDARLLDCR